MKKYKIFLKRLLAAVLAITMLVSLDRGEYLIAAAEQTPDVVLGNSLIQVTAHPQTGRFVVATQDGLPNKVSDRNMLLSFLDQTPDTSFTTFRIDGKDYIFGNSYLGKGGIVKNTQLEGNSLVTVWSISGVEVTQRLTLVTDLADPQVGNVKISYEVSNASGHKVELGSRILVDTQLGANDGSALVANNQYVTNEKSFEGDQVPMLWQSSDRQYAANVTAKGVLYGWDNIEPDRLSVAHWNTLANTKWDCEVNEYLNFTTSKNKYGSADSAVAVYFNPTELSAGDTRTYETFYGIGSVSDTVNSDDKLSVQITAPQKLSLNSTKDGYADSSKSFEMNVTVTNHSESSYSNLSVNLGLSEVLKLYGEESSTQIINSLAAGDSYTMRWRVVPEVQKDTMVAEIGVSVECASDGVNQTAAQGIKYVILPGISGETPQMQFVEVAPDTIYTESLTKKVTIKGSAFNLLNAETGWTMTFSNDLTGESVNISRADIAISDDSTMKVTLPDSDTFSYKVGDYTLRLNAGSHGTLSTTIHMTDDPDFDKIEYGVMLIGNMAEEGDDPCYGVKLLETEEEMEEMSEDELDNVLLTVRGCIEEYELNDHVYYSIGNGAIFNSAIKYYNVFNKSAVITVTRYEEQSSESLEQDFQNQFSGWKWWGQVSDSLVLSGTGTLAVGDYAFHTGDFYICLEDENIYELRGGELDNPDNNEDLNGNIGSGEIKDEYQSETSEVEIITPAGVVGNELAKLIGALTGMRIEVSNAVFGEETISLGGSVSLELPWWSKAAKDPEDEPEEEDPNMSQEEKEKKAKEKAAKDKFDKNDKLNGIVGEGSKNDNFLELNMEEMRYGINEEDNTSDLVGVKADGGITLNDDSVPKFTKGGANASFKLNSIDYPGWFIGIGAGLKVGDAFECEAEFSLVKEDSGKCYPDSIKFVAGGDVVHIPLGTIGFLNKMGGGISGLYATIKNNYNIFPPTTLSVFSGYEDPTTVALTIDDITLSAGGQGVSFEAEEGKVVGLKILESIGAHFKLYGTKMEDGSVYPCMDMGADISINILGIVKGEAGVWFVVDPRLNTVFGNLSLGGKAYCGIFIPDWIPVLGGTELLAAMVELSTYRAYAGIRIIGIPISVGYYWEEGKVKFFDKEEVEEEQAEEYFANALAFEEDLGEESEDGMMVLGDNMTLLQSKTREVRNGYENTVDIRNNDYTLIQAAYDAKDLGERKSILDYVKVFDPDGNEIQLVENENCLLQHISKDVSDSGVDEYNLGIGLVAPKNGIWKIKSEIQLEITPRKVDEIAGVQAEKVEIENKNKIKVSYNAAGLKEGYSADLYLVNTAEMTEMKAVLSEEELAKLSEEKRNEYYESMLQAAPSGYKITEESIPLTVGKDGKSSGTVTATLPETTFSGDYAVRLVINGEDGEARTSDITENFITFTNPNTPAKVENLTMVPGGDNQFLLNWDAVDGATGYFVQLLDENGNPVEGMEGMMTTDTSMYLGYTYEKPIYQTDGTGKYVTDKNDNYVQIDSKTVGIFPDRYYKAMVCAYKTVDMTDYLSEARITEALYLPEENPAILSYQVNGKSPVHGTVTSSDKNARTEEATTDNYHTSINQSEMTLDITPDQDVTLMVALDGDYGDYDMYDVKAGTTKSLKYTLPDGGSVLNVMAKNDNGDYTMEDIVVEVDTQPPSLMLDHTVVQSKNGDYKITGTVESNTSVKVNGQNAAVSHGKFVYQGKGNSKAEQITVSAIDISGNETSMLCEVIPSEVSRFVDMKICVDDDNIDPDTQSITLSQTDSASLSFYGVMENGSTMALDSSKVTAEVLMGDGVTRLEGNVLSAYYAGDAFYEFSYPLTDDYDLKQTLAITVSQMPIVEADISISSSDTVIDPEKKEGESIANLIIPGAPNTMKVEWSIEENDWLDISGNTLILKKKIDPKKLTDGKLTVKVRANCSYPKENTSAQTEEDSGQDIITVEKEISFTILKNVTAIASSGEDIAVDVGTDFNTLISSLPEKVNVTLNDGAVLKDCPVIWQQGAYNKDVARIYTIKGKVSLPEDIRNTDNLQAEQCVNVQKLNIINYGEDKTVIYDGNTVDVSTMFTRDANAGAASYSVNPLTGEGSLNGTGLSVTKAGTFEVTMQTAATDYYESRSVTAILTVNKGSQNAPEGITVTNAGTTFSKDGVISGVNSAMEYSPDEGKTWIPVEGTQVKGLGIGTYQIRYKETDLYLVGEATSITIINTGKTPQSELKAELPDTVTYGDGVLKITVTGGSGSGNVTYTTNNDKVIKVKDGNLSIVGAGTAIVTASKAEDKDYNAASVSVEVNVKPKTVELKWNNVTDREYDGTPSDLFVSPLNLEKGDTCQFSLEGHQAINAGSHEAVVTGLTNHNYQLPDDTRQEYQILPRKVDLEWKLPEKLIYNGSNQLDAVVATYKDINNVSRNSKLSVKSEIMKDAGSYTVTAEIEDKNYTLKASTQGQQHVEIQQAKPNLKLTAEVRDKKGLLSKIASVFKVDTKPDVKLTAALSGVTGESLDGKIEFYEGEKLVKSVSVNKNQATTQLSGVDFAKHSYYCVFIPGNISKKNYIRVISNTETIFVEKSQKAEQKPLPTNTSSMANALNKGMNLSWKGNALTVSFGKVSLAKGYDVFLQRVGKKYTTKPVASVKSTKNQVSIRKISGKKLDQRKSYKLVVKAYRIVNGKKKYIAASKELRFVGRKSKLTNAKKVSVKKKSVTLRVGKKTKMSVTVKKENAKKKLYKGGLAKYRYWSTDTSIATVSKSGVIMAKKRGTCYVYVMTPNGKKARMKVIVK